MMKKLYVIKNDELFVNNESIVFPYPISQVECISNVLIVRLETRPRIIFNKNVFGVSLAGKLIWQIAEVPHVGQIDKPYDNIAPDELGQVIVSDWIGFDYYLDVTDGSVTVKSFSRF